MAVKTVPFDAAEFLDTEEAQAAYLADMMESGDPALTAQAISTVARACATATPDPTTQRDGPRRHEAAPGRCGHVLRPPRR